tara:strand:+ start:343 stop:966 length:624 start_codon:yes stop_codon:yes gene_type:complete
MTINPETWINTLPKTKIRGNENMTINPETWINTLPKKKIRSSSKKTSTILLFFVVSLVAVSMIKNSTRNLEKEISDLKAEIKNLKMDLHQETLEHEVITSPENISKMAKEYLDFNLIPYKKSQVKELYENDPSTNERELKSTVSINKIKNLPKKTKLEVAAKIKNTKKNLENLYEDPKGSIDKVKVQKWAVLQLVKAFIGMPIIPGR